jgi:rare lipoprotein A (peptidoglycan hydrolase)
VTVYQPAVASWYTDAGSTACGFHAYYGVASPSLPCGAHVRFVYGGHTLQAVVDDRGPFVPGRSWDLNQNTAGALGFGGVDTVWTSY